MSSKVIDLTGQIFGMLTAKERKWYNDKHYWLCCCKCGGERIVSLYSLKSGKTTDCGCIKKKIKKRNYEENKETIRKREEVKVERAREKYFNGNRRKTLERDNYRCQICDKDVKKIRYEVHHIDFTGGTKESNNELNNLITICIKCHRKIHARKKNNAGGGIK